MQIGILSDTHGLLRPEVKEILRGCDAILHAGDIDRQKILSELEEIAPVYAVRGNADKEWAKNLPMTLTVNFGGKNFFLVHNKKDVMEDAKKADYIVFGHSHKYEEKRVEKQIWLNPGSCGRRRFTLPITFMLMEIDDEGEGKVQRIDLTGEKAVTAPVSQLDMYTVVKNVVREMNRGRSVEEIAVRCGIEKDLAEQICRMYATHPGIDVDGILNRITKFII